MQHSDISAVMEGLVRPTEETDDSGTDMGTISAELPFTPGLLDTTGGTLQQRRVRPRQPGSIRDPVLGHGQDQSSPGGNPRILRVR